MANTHQGVGDGGAVTAGVAVSEVQAQSEDLQRRRPYPLMLSSFYCACALRIADAKFWAS